MTDPVRPVTSIRDSERSLISRRKLVFAAGTSVFGLGLTRSVSGKHDDHDDDRDRDDHDDDRDDRNRNRDNDDIRPAGTVPAGSAEVIIDDDDADGFQPGRLTIDLGQSVTWVNLDDDPHTATGGSFDTGTMQPGQMATVTFDELGIFPYSCQFHPIMTGTIEVRDESGSVPSNVANAESATPAASPGATPQAGATQNVDIDNLAFSPESLTVSAGTTVVWTNRETIPHTVTATDGAFDSGILQQGDTFERTFEEAGTVDYICNLHPSMKGRIVVENGA